MTEKSSAFADPELLRLDLTCNQAFEWDPGDPRLSKLAAAIAAWSSRRRPEQEEPGSATLDLILLPRHRPRQSGRG